MINNPTQNNITQQNLLKVVYLQAEAVVDWQATDTFIVTGPT